MLWRWGGWGKEIAEAWGGVGVGWIGGGAMEEWVGRATREERVA